MLDFRVKTRFAAGVLVALSFLSSCSKTTPSTSARPTEQQVLQAYAEEGISVAWQKLRTSSAELEMSIKALCEKPSAEALTKAKEAWLVAYKSWCESESFMFMTKRQINREVDEWPLNDVVFAAALKDEQFANLLKDKNSRGFAAMEYILFTAKDAQEASTGIRKKQLLTIAKAYSKLVVSLKADWQKAPATEFAKAGDGQPYLTEAEGLAVAYGEILNVTERILRERLGVPSGYFKAGVKGNMLEAWRSNNFHTGLSASLDSIDKSLNVGGDNSFSVLIETKDGLVEESNPLLAADIKEQILKISQSINDLPKLEINKALQQNPMLLKDLYTEFQTLQEQLIEGGLVLELDVHQGLLQLRDPLAELKKDPGYK